MAVATAGCWLARVLVAVGLATTDMAIRGLESAVDWLGGLRKCGQLRKQTLSGLDGSRRSTPSDPIDLAVALQHVVTAVVRLEAGGDLRLGADP